MIDFIYGVALNGTSKAPTKHKVVAETPARFIIDRPVNSYINKVYMTDRWEAYFLDEDEAETFRKQLLAHIERQIRHFDHDRVYRILLKVRNGEWPVEKLDEAINYIKEFI